jgi:mono/diheme cytochrome c family protein
VLAFASIISNTRGKTLAHGDFMKNVSILALLFAFGCSTIAYAQDDASALYKTKCQACHGADGKGDTPVGQKLGVKDFHSPEVAKMSDQELFEITKNGKNKMPKYDGKLTDDQIKSLIKYIRSLK